MIGEPRRWPGRAAASSVPGLLEQVRGAGNDLDAMFAPELTRRLAVEGEHSVVQGADDEQRRGADGAEPWPGEVGTPASGHDRRDVGVRPRGREERGRRRRCSRRSSRREASRHPVWARSQVVAPRRRRASSSMSKTLARSAASAWVSRSNRSVPRPARFSVRATAMFRRAVAAAPAAVGEEHDAGRGLGEREMAVRAARPGHVDGHLAVAGVGPSRRAGSLRQRARRRPLGRRHPRAGRRPRRRWSDAKSAYHCPSDRKSLGVCEDDHLVGVVTQRFDRFRRRDRYGEDRLGRLRARERLRTRPRAVPPVASPSSTTITVRPRSETIGRSPRYLRARRSTSTRSRASTACELPLGHVQPTTARSRFSTRAPPSPIAPIAELGLRRQAELAHDQHVERRAERSRDLVRDRHAPPGSPSTTGRSPRQRSQPRRQLPSGVPAIAKAGAPWVALAPSDAAGIGLGRFADVPARTPFERLERMGHVPVDDRVELAAPVNASK